MNNEQDKIIEVFGEKTSAYDKLQDIVADALYKHLEPEILKKQKQK